MKYHDNIDRENLYIPHIHGIDWYKSDISDTFQKLKTDQRGLFEEDIKERQIEFGRNELPPRKPPTVLKVFMHQLKSPLIYILMFAGFVALIINDITDAVFIFGIILLNSILGTYQEYRAEKSALSLQNLIMIHAKVRRKGRESLIPSAELVPGDIVMLESGDKVPADLRLFEANNLSIDESFLTGESRPISKVAAKIKRDTPMAERTNIAYAGSVVTSGRGIGAVFSTGVNTEVGRIAHSVIHSESAKPPLVLRMEKFSRNISVAVMLACVILSLIALSKQMPFAQVIFMAVALAVSAIPEGLPVALTVALSIGTKRMADRNVIIRKLTAVEGLGSCTYIASDKTGTLTLNKQMVRTALMPDGLHFSIKGEEISGEGEISLADGNTPDEKQIDTLRKMAEIVSICNEGNLFYEDERWVYSGDSVDVALLSFAYKAGVDIALLRDNSEIIAEIPYESENRLAAVLYRSGKKNRISLAVKGAVETIIPLCSKMNYNNAEMPLDLDKKLLDNLSIRLSSDGYRVLGIAYSDAGSREDLSHSADDFTIESLRGLTFAGFIGMTDPLRPDAGESVKQAINAGVKVAMVTGDHPATALAISKELGIAEDDNDVITGEDLERTGPPDIPEFLEKVRSCSVFARVTPVQKLEIVEALLRLGHFVAVTGDGVNDAPALKRASIGVAMGSGTEVTKETADIIITDDKFSSIVHGIEEGRIAYDNIRKVVYLLLSTGLAEILLFIYAMSTSFHDSLILPLLAVQILWLNLVTNGIQDIALAFEKGEADIMKRNPKEPEEGIFNKQMLMQVAVSGIVISIAVFAVWTWLLDEGYSVVKARSLVLMLMVLMQNVHLFNCRSERRSVFSIPLKNNYILILGLFSAHLIHIIASHIPFMQSLLSIEPVTSAEWGYLFFISIVLLIAMEMFKILNKNKKA